MAQSVKASSSSPRLDLLLIARNVGIGFYAVAVVLVFCRIFFTPPQYDHYYLQSVSWLNGRLDINNAPSDLPDVVTYQNNKYLPLGVFPTVLTLPFVMILGENYREIYLMLPLVAITAWMCWRIVAKLKVAYPSTHIWLIALFCLSTLFLSCVIHADGAWFIAHVVTSCFTFLAVDEALGKKRPVLIGLYLGITAATRFTVLFTFPFYLWLLAVRANYDLKPPIEAVNKAQKLQFEPTKTIITRYILLGVGAAVPLAFYFINNYLRFNSFLESGYGLAALSPKDALYQAREQGLFGLIHLPKNLYYFLLATPEPWGGKNIINPADSPFLIFPYLRPSPWGMSIFLTTPAVVYLFKANLRRPFVQACWAAIILSAIPVLTYYGVGWVQFGYRYAMDFTPFIWLLIVYVLREREISFSKRGWAFWLIVGGCIINLWGSYCLLFMRFNL